MPAAAQPPSPGPPPSGAGHTFSYIHLTQFNCLQRFALPVGEHERLRHPSDQKARRCRAAGAVQWGPCGGGRAAGAPPLTSGSKVPSDTGGLFTAFTSSKKLRGILIYRTTPKTCPLRRGGGVKFPLQLLHKIQLKRHIYCIYIYTCVFVPC